MMIPATVSAKLNEQVRNEMDASQKYLAIACQFDGMGLKSLAAYFRKQTEEEREHALKIVDYLLEVGAEVKLAEIPAPQGAFPTVVAAIDAAVAHEQLVTRQIHDLVALSEKEKDYATRSFLQWYVDEQVEEVSTMSQLAQVARLAKDNLLQLDGYVGRLLSK